MPISIPDCEFLCHFPIADSPIADAISGTVAVISTLTRLSLRGSADCDATNGLPSATTSESDSLNIVIRDGPVPFICSFCCWLSSGWYIERQMQIDSAIRAHRRGGVDVDDAVSARGSNLTGAAVEHDQADALLGLNFGGDRVGNRDVHLDVLPSGRRLGARLLHWGRDRGFGPGGGVWPRPCCPWRPCPGMACPRWPGGGVWAGCGGAVCWASDGPGGSGGAGCCCAFPIATANIVTIPKLANRRICTSKDRPHGQWPKAKSEESNQTVECPVPSYLMPSAQCLVFDAPNGRNRKRVASDHVHTHQRDLQAGWLDRFGGVWFLDGDRRCERERGHGAREPFLFGGWYDRGRRR